MRNPPNDPKGKETEQVEEFGPEDVVGEPLDSNRCEILIVLKKTTLTSVKK